MAISDEITRLQNAKSALKTSIEAKGVTVSDTTLISDYATYVDQIQTGSGGGGGDDILRDLIERDITTLNIPSGTTQIGDYAFQSCNGLTSVSIPNSVTSIGGSAFGGCEGLTSITIPNSVTEIYNYAFENCSGLTSIVWNAKNCKNFSSNSKLFSNSTNINTIEFGSEVERIPNYLCYKLNGLTSVTIPNPVTEIGDNSFQNCSGLTSVTIGNSVTSIGFNAFNRCNKLNSVTIGNSVTIIGGNAFYGCSALTSVTIQATTPPTLNSNAFNSTNNCPIYVPAESVDAYKTATNWSSYASRINPIPTE